MFIESSNMERKNSEIIPEVYADFVARREPPEIRYSAASRDLTYITALNEYGFFSPEKKIVEVCVGPSPHIGFELARNLDSGYSVTYNDRNQSCLDSHETLYKILIQHIEGETPSTEWNQGDYRECSDLIRDSNILVNYLSTDDVAKEVKTILRLQPNRAAFFFGPDRIDEIEDVIKKQGVRYQRQNGLYSCNFRNKCVGDLIFT